MRRAYFRQRLWALAYGGGLALLTALPYAAAWQAQGQTWCFSGFLVGLEDGNSYIAKMLLGSQGAWLFRPPYTTWPVDLLPVFLPYLWLGKLAAGQALHLQLTLLFHWVRVLGVVALVLATYDFLGLFLAIEHWRRWGTVLTTAGAGLGWLLAPFVHLGWAGPLCFYSPETYGFLAALLLPHLTWARALLLWILRRILTARHAKAAWHAALLTLILGWLHPLELVPLLALLLVWGGVPLLGQRWCSGKKGVKLAWRRWGQMAAPAWSVAVFWSVFYVVLSYRQEYLQVWNMQNLIPSPPPWQYLFAYGWLLPFALWGRPYWLRGGWRKALPWLWVFLLPVLLYAPLTVQRRLADGVWVAVSALVSVGWAERERGFEQRGASLRTRQTKYLSLGSAALLGLAVFPNLLFWAQLFRPALTPQQPVFLPRAEVVAFQALAARAQNGDGVLAAYTTGNALPAWAPVRVIAGLGPESPYLGTQRQNLRRFFDPAVSDEWRRNFLAQQHIRWVFWGPSERELGAWQPTSAAFLCLRYTDKTYAFFEVCP